jgi:uncharacterized protein YwqG
MDTLTLEHALAEAGLKSRAGELARLARPSLRLGSTLAPDEAALALGVSKLGGQPDLPYGEPWPERQGKPLAFVAQLRLADLAVFDLALPPDGTLLFFYDAAQEVDGTDPAARDGWRVLYAPAGQALQRAPAPEALPKEARFHPCALEPAAELTLPQDVQALLPQERQLSEKEQESYETFQSKLAGAQRGGAAVHRALGYPDQIQDNVLVEAALAAHGLSDPQDPQFAAVSGAAPAEWTLLLQLDSDPQAGMRWSSSGMLYYAIPRAALRRQDFSQTWLVMQAE